MGKHEVPAGIQNMSAVEFRGEGLSFIEKLELSIRLGQRIGYAPVKSFSVMSNLP